MFVLVFVEINFVTVLSFFHLHTNLCSDRPMEILQSLLISANGVLIIPLWGFSSMV